jgi:sodium/potassium-transporting ATPase subunit alpha
LASVLWIAAILAFTEYAIEEGTHSVSGYSISSNLLVGVILVIINVVSEIFTFYQREKTRKTLEGFKKLVPQRAIVLRDGLHPSIDASELVVGDIVSVVAGDKVPADVRVIDANGCKVDGNLSSPVLIEPLLFSCSGG